jgi:2-polyprenyl-3-methyl-5-hydroxy-6-metoxy-1,4-benzoquinol methylase
MSAAQSTSQSSRQHRVIVEDGVIAGNYTDKYGSGNPIHRKLMAGFHAALDELLEHSGAKTVHEVGCGEGHLSAHLYQRGLAVRGSDFSEQVIDAARKNASACKLDIEFKVASVYDLAPPDDAAELVVCCEVLEHLDDPQRGLEVLSKLAQPWLIVSVPREPLWRFLNMARGKYINDLGNTPGHLNHWSRRSFVQFLSRRVDIVEVRMPLPWTMILCRARRVTG